MGKKNTNKRNGVSGIPDKLNGSAGQAVALDKLAPVWTASFENASKVYQSCDNVLDIEIEQDKIRAVLGRLQQDEDASSVAKWIERFADVCKELGKYQEKLNQEYEERWALASKIGEESEAQKKKTAEDLERIAEDRADIEQRQSALETAELALAKNKSELLERERSLKEREINAEAGFVKQNEMVLKQLEVQQRDLLKQKEADRQALQEKIRSLQDEVSQAEKNLSEFRFKYTEAESERIKSFEEREDEIKQSKLMLDRARARLDREWAELKSAEDALEERVASELERERGAHSAELAKISSQRDKAWEKVQSFREQLLELQELQNALGERTPAEILESLDNLQSENRELKRKLEQSDTAGLQHENQHLRDRVADLERDIAALRPELDDARRELSVKRVAATELEAVAREKRVLEMHKNKLSVHIDDLESRIDKLTNAQKSQTAFPAMSLMDSEREYQASIELEHVPDLESFAAELQHRIARAESRVELFYPIEDIRVLLGGLAMSQLHVFQGISGTGKTSLAKAFAKAMGGFCTDIAVQAGWRDRDDLLGHFNAFERRFYEKDCLQALYKSQTPRWQDTCNVILLDEMNLSRPEQYFAEFLSAIEKNSRDDRAISLSETALPGAPKMLKDGRQILVPDNVWFIGTANHDETTNELADKTYDRSHVMTLPKQDHRFDIKEYQPASFSFKSLQRAFDTSCKEHASDVRGLLNELTNSNFTSQLESDFGLGWGNRFEKQALRFVPVMLASGATTGDALDHLLASRVMRQGKVTGRFDVAPDAVRNLMDTLGAFWTQAKLEGIPEKSLEALEKDIKRKEAGF